jgi:hypothetical protein
VKEEQTDRLITAIERLSMGGIHNPSGFEALTMALCGGMPGQQDSVAYSLAMIASAIETLADAVKDLAS